MRGRHLVSALSKTDMLLSPAGSAVGICRETVATTLPRKLTASETKQTGVNDQAVRRVLEAAGEEFIDDNGGGPGRRLRNRHQKEDQTAANLLFEVALDAACRRADSIFYSGIS
jgi:hypothetical protein